MTEESIQSIADSMEVSQEILIHMPYLLQDLWALGCAEDQITEAAQRILQPGKGKTILDLGCGKGAAAIQIAEKCHCRAVGVDAMEKFLKTAENNARKHNVDHLCRFIRSDIHDYIKDKHSFDMVLLASLGSILGTLKQTVGKLRNQVKTGGWIFIDDGYLRKKNRLTRKGYSHYRNHEQTCKELTSFGDRIVEEISTTEQSLQINARYLEVIRKRGDELVRIHPLLAKPIEKYISLQKEECSIIDSDIEGALWIIQKK